MVKPLSVIQAWKNKIGKSVDTAKLVELNDTKNFLHKAYYTALGAEFIELYANIIDVILLVIGSRQLLDGAVSLTCPSFIGIFLLRVFFQGKLCKLHMSV